MALWIAPQGVKHPSQNRLEFSGGVVHDFAPPLNIISTTASTAAPSNMPGSGRPGCRSVGAVRGLPAAPDTALPHLWGRPMSPAVLTEVGSWLLPTATALGARDGDDEEHQDDRVASDESQVAGHSGDDPRHELRCRAQDSGQ